MSRRDENDAGRSGPAPATGEPPLVHTFCNSDDPEDACMADRATPERLPVLEPPAEWRYLGAARGYDRGSPKARAGMAPTLAEIEAVGYVRIKARRLVPMDTPPAPAGAGPGST